VGFRDLRKGVSFSKQDAFVRKEEDEDDVMYVLSARVGDGGSVDLYSVTASMKTRLSDEAMALYASVHKIPMVDMPKHWRHMDDAHFQACLDVSAAKRADPEFDYHSALLGLKVKIG